MVWTLQNTFISIDELQGEFEDKVNIIKVDVDNSMDIAQQYNISKYPSLGVLKKR